jgi:uncharacterized protein YjbI with pentapeptide repeats
VSNADPPLDLSNLDLRGAIITQGDTVVDPTGRSEYKAANLSDADLSGTDLRGASFFGVDLEGVRFRGADLRGATFVAVRFAEGGTIPAGGSGSTRFEGADLRGANLEAVDASSPDLGFDPHLSDADLRGALADGSTRWPHGFDWRAEGVEMG